MSMSLPLAPSPFPNRLLKAPFNVFESSQLRQLNAATRRVALLLP